MKEYLQQEVNEINQLQINGFEFQRKHWNIKIHSLICDTPAPAFVKCVKCFSGYHGCDRCEQRGKWEGKMTYPEIRANLRTILHSTVNEMKNIIQEIHHSLIHN